MMISTGVNTDTTTTVSTLRTHGLVVEPAYLGTGDPGRWLTDFSFRTTRARDYHPIWVDRLADDVMLEGSAMNGAVQGAEAVRSIVTYIRSLYEHQMFNFAGPYGENGFIEDYNARVQGEPIGNSVLITRNSAGEAQHITANYRPRNTLQLLSRQLSNHFAGSPYGQYFAAKQDVGTLDMRLEVATLPVTDIERAKHFYQSLGWRLDADIIRGDAFRAVQMTPPHSPCSIVFGKGLGTAAPGSARLELVVFDIDTAREDLIRRGVGVGEVYHLDGGRVPGPDPQRRSYQSYASFADPDGNTWLLQEIKVRLPGRLWEEDQ
jgi:catechol 2,3-dioxygenase-like lactoylglutathione lyase family enzyme